jgi:hypothetical protein
MIVLTPIAFILSRNFWVTGADESTASTRGSVVQNSAAGDVDAEIAKLPTNIHTDLAGLLASRLPAGIGIP